MACGSRAGLCARTDPSGDKTNSILWPTWQRSASSSRAHNRQSGARESGEEKNAIMRLVRIQLCVSARSRFVCVLHESTRARTSSTRATHVDARTKSFGPRIRDTDLFIARPCLSFNSSRRSLRRAPARLVSRREEKRDRRRFPRTQRAQAAEHARRAKRAHQRYAARRTDHFDVHSRHSYHLARPLSVARISATAPCVRRDPAWRSGPAERAVRSTGRAEHARRARWASSARLSSRFRLADPIRAPPLPFLAPAQPESSRALGTSPSHPGALKSKRKHAYRRVVGFVMPRGPRARKFVVSRADPVVAELKTHVREGWGAHTSDGNRRDAERMRRSRRWWTPCRSTCGRTTTSGTCTREREMRGSKHRIPWRTRNDENSCDLTAPPPLLLGTGLSRKCASTRMTTGRCRSFAAPKSGSLTSAGASSP